MPGTGRPGRAACPVRRPGPAGRGRRRGPAGRQAPYTPSMQPATVVSISRRRQQGGTVTPGQHRARRGLPRAGTAAAVALVLAGCGTAGYGAPVAPASMSIGSEAFIQGGLAPRYTCHGVRISPPVNWSGAPLGTKSLALI